MNDVCAARLCATIDPVAQDAPCTGQLPAPELSATEWLVVEMARRDGLSSLNTPSWVATAFRRLFGIKSVNRLVDPRLESLRRVAVHGWRKGKLPDGEVERFLAAGFSFDQLMLVFTAIGGRRG
jgi:hypothetical protein